MINTRNNLLGSGGAFVQNDVLSGLDYPLNVLYDANRASGSAEIAAAVPGLGEIARLVVADFSYDPLEIKGNEVYAVMECWDENGIVP